MSVDRLSDGLFGLGSEASFSDVLLCTSLGEPNVIAPEEDFVG